MRPPPPRIYLDANATTPLLPEVFEAMRPWYLEHFGNPSSVHQPGQRARSAVDQARAAVARLLHCKPQEIVFTSGGTESDNLALFGTVQPGQHLITSTIEHHAVLHAAEALAKQGVDVTFLPCDPDGIVQPETLRAALRPDTRLVSVMLANNETGAIQPLAELARITKARSTALFHTDAVQGAGKLPLDLGSEGALKDIDLLALSGHKMYAPQGVGVLFVRSGVKLAPLFHGGTHERERRAGTENVPGIVALGKAADLACAWMTPPNPSAPSHTVSPSEVGSTKLPSAPSHTVSPSEVGSTKLPGAPSQTVPSSEVGSTTESNTPNSLTHLRDHLEQSLLTQIPHSGINSAAAPRTANTSNLYFDGIEAESLVITLDLNGLSVSGGSACQSGAAEPSHVLLAMGLSPARARASIRISLSRQTTAAEIEDAIRLIATSVAQLRSITKPGAPGSVTVPS